MTRKRTWIVWGLVAVAAIAVQFFQPPRTNPRSDPAASFEAAVQPPRPVAQILNRACRDCHSNHTVWPWYSRVAPVSWMVVRDVRQGRAHMNLSEWRGLTPEVTSLRMIDVCAETRKGEMPPWYYVPLHREAWLNAQDVHTLCAWPGELSFRSEMDPQP